MTEEKFIAKNEAKWKQLEAYNEILLRKGIKALSRDDVRTFAELFRLAGFHLAYAKTHYPNGVSLPYINRIVGVAHNYFYVRETGSLSDIKVYFTHRFPAAARAAKWYFAVSTALFLVGLLFASLYVASDTTRFAQIFPGEYGGGLDGGGWDYPLMSAVIMTNNIRVAVTVFVTGILGGIGTVLTLLYNGLIIGALSAYVASSDGDMVKFLSLILPHGVLELTAIFLSGACGLMIGRAVLIPGPFSRKDALVKSAKDAAMLVPGIVVMLVIAGLIEGFFTPMDIAPVFKLVFAALTAVGLCLYGARG